MLNNRNIRDRYKFDALQEISETPTPNDEYENFVNASIDASAECIPTKQRAKPRFPWETLTVRKKACGYKKKMLPYARRNPTNINAPKPKKAENELTNVYLKEQTEYIKN